MNQDNTIKALLVLIIVLVIALGLRITVFKDVNFEKEIDLSSEAVVNAVANKTSDYVKSTQKEKEDYNEISSSLDEYSNKN